MFGSSSASGLMGQSPPFIPSSQYSLSGLGSSSGLASPTNLSGFGVGVIPPVPISSGGSPIYQGSSMNKFPAGGGPVVFTPHGQTTPPGHGHIASATPVSPYSYVGGTASSFVQSPASIMAGGGGGIFSPPAYSSTMIGGNLHHSQQVTSPLAHGYGQPLQYASNLQPSYGYGSRNMTGSGGGYAYNSPYQHIQSPQSYSHPGHHSPHEITEPMHCSPVGQAQSSTVGGLHYQQPHRNAHSPQQRAQYMPAFLTGVDSIVVAQTRPRRMFERSPSTSPPVVGATAGSRSPNSKSPTWAQEGSQSASAGFPNQADVVSPVGGLYGKRAQGHGPSRQLRFIDGQMVQNGEVDDEDKEKHKKTGPPIRGFGSAEDVISFLKSPLLRENNGAEPGAVIAQEAIAKFGVKSQIAESNWITVFGFPPAAASFIYTHFAQHGPILQSKCNPGGNWLHIQYSSIIDARKALSRNGKVLGGTIMVGVISSPREVIEMYEKSQQNLQPQPADRANFSTQQQQHVVVSPLQERNLDTSTTSETAKTKGIRHLAGQSQLTSPVLGGREKSLLSTNENFNRSALSPSTGNENIPLPTSSTGIFTKAMEYMFGW